MMKLIRGNKMSDSETEKFVKKLQSHDVTEKIEAANTLGTIKNEESVNALINSFDDDNPEVRLQAAKSLAEIGDPAVGPLIRTLKKEEGHARRYATFALKDIGDSSAVHHLMGALKDEDWGVRKFSAQALGEIGDVEAVESLIELLQDEDYGVKVAATRALGDIGDERAVDPIKKARRAAKGDKDYKKVANKVLKKFK
jgi:HEAT repeat protein